jgi:energy-coupling factor transporter ATP-binding protein EcfA2
MYITRVQLEDVRCFKKLDVNFKRLGQTILIAGDNGDGKSALLRSIAMGLCDESSAAALLRELSGPFIRKGKKQAKIRIFLSGNGAIHYEIETTIHLLPAFEKVTQKVWRHEGNKRPKLVPPEDFSWEEVFVTAYGAGSRTQGTADYQRYIAVDAVYTLFRYDEHLQNPELSVRRLVELARKKGGNSPRKAQYFADKMLERLRSVLERVLNLGHKDRLFLTEKGIEVKGPWGRSELGALGDGYVATITWVMDLIAWWMLDARPLDYQRMRGIVLLDEVEQHLHPRWQLKIMSLLTEAFPKMQFIATTHSPLVISGCKGIPVHTLHYREHLVQEAHGWLAEDVYRRIMGLPTTRAPIFEQLIADYAKLHSTSLGRKLPPTQASALRKLKGRLQSLPSTDPIALTTALRNLSQQLGPSRRQAKE